MRDAVMGRFEVVLSRSVCTLDKKEFVEHSDPERTRANIPLFQQGIMNSSSTPRSSWSRPW